MPQVERFVFHIGVPKTGSTLLQKCLRGLRPRLREHGIAYIDRSKMTSLTGYPAWILPRRDVGLKDEFMEGLAEVVRSERSKLRSDERIVMLSNEAASGRARNFDAPFWRTTVRAMSDVVSVIDPVATEVVVYVRRQDQLLESLYMQRIHSGATRTWRDFKEQACREDHVRYSDLLEKVRSVPTVDRVRVRPFEIIKGGASPFVADFLQGIGVAELTRLLPEKAFAATNTSYTQPAWEAAMAINPLLDQSRTGKAAQARRLRKFLRDLFPRSDYPRVKLLTDEERAALIEAYRPENERFFKEYLPQFPSDTYSTLHGIDQLAGFLAPTAPES